MATLNTDIRYIKGVGEARAKSLAKLGITDLRSLLSYFPRAYDDRRAYKKIADLIPGENACVCAVIAGEPKLSRIRKGLDLIKLRAVDETGALELTYFNQSYLKNTFHTGDAYVFFGRAEGTPSRPQMTNPLFEREGAHQITGRIMPIYPLTAGVSQSMLCKAVEQGLAACVDELPDILPENVRLVYKLATPALPTKTSTSPQTTKPSPPRAAALRSKSFSCSRSASSSCASAARSSRENSAKKSTFRPFSPLSPFPSPAHSAAPSAISRAT